MITAEQYKKISNQYGYVASWAIWDKAGDKPKSNISNMDVFNDKKNSELLSILKTDVIMVGLNFSRNIQLEKPFINFHDKNPYGNDFKIRYAFENTPYYGAYMTDIIKNLAMPSSKEVLAYLKDKPEILKKQIIDFRNEMKFIQSTKPIIIAFGKDVYNILYKHLNKNEYTSLIQVTHYSHQISKEKYRKEIHSKLNIVQPNTEVLMSVKKKLKEINIVIDKTKISSNADQYTMQKIIELTNELLRKLNSK
jgi:hypothetical protein